jgi:lipopolysaccharide transport system ATP-binding protein
MEFQQKCIGKMEEVSQHGGRTILFVSHNMNYIAGLCDSAILLDKGTILSRGKPGDVINGYTDQVISKYNENILESPAGNGVVGLQALRLTGTSGDYKNNFRVTEKIGIEMEFEVTEPGHILWLGYNLHNADGINIFDTHNVSAPQYSQPYAKGKYRAIAWIPENFLNTGNYYVSCAVFNHLKNIIHFHEKDVSMFHVYDVFDEQTARGRSPHDFPGIVRPLLDWEINQKES